MNQLGLALAIASTAFKEKTDKGGEPYMMHCIRVMQGVNTKDVRVKAAAVLHDLLEDCKDDWSAKRLLDAGVDGYTVGLVRMLTHDKENMQYEDYINLIAGNHDARQIKLSDLRDNSNITRLKGLSKKDFDRMEKYLKAYTYLNY